MGIQLKPISRWDATSGKAARPVSGIRIERVIHRLILLTRVYKRSLAYVDPLKEVRVHGHVEHLVHPRKESWQGSKTSGRPAYIYGDSSLVCPFFLSQRAC